MSLVLALKVNDKDNVATVFAQNVAGGDMVEVRDKKGDTQNITANADIPYGHKLALRKIVKGEAIVKYGEELGRASSDIEPGDHVHVHNLESMRGRGDL